MDGVCKVTHIGRAYSIDCHSQLVIDMGLLSQISPKRGKLKKVLFNKWDSSVSMYFE